MAAVVSPGRESGGGAPKRTATACIIAWASRQSGGSNRLSTSLRATTGKVLAGAARPTQNPTLTPTQCTMIGHAGAVQNVWTISRAVKRSPAFTSISANVAYRQSLYHQKSGQ